MVPVSEILEQAGFLKQLFDAIPCGVLIMDQDRHIHAVNRVVRQTFGDGQLEIVQQRTGELFNCINVDKRGCGFSETCQQCLIKDAAVKAVKGEQIYRNRTTIKVRRDGKVADQVLLISAGPANIDNREFAIIVIEDITELNTLRSRLKTEHSFSGIVGRDSAILDVFDTIREVVDFNVPILVQGESGTGKELVASAIHNEGSRAKKAFVPVNCGALPEGLLESELFGHVKGSFTGAVRDKKGRFELADGGTLFLDEIAELPKVVQPKLLRVLQEGRFEPVGSEKTVSVDVRIVTATNKDLKQEMKKGNFREDLYYRVNVVPINLPPLRKRKNDIALLVDHFLEKARGEGHEIKGISADAMAVMIDYPWPGNVRELQSAIWFGIVKGRGGMVHATDLPLELRKWHGDFPSRGPSPKLKVDTVRKALGKTGGNKAKAARVLGVGRATLYRFLNEYPELANYGD
jgi:transcriptional regulator with PAS, ATPase and Fis domain